MPPGSHNQYPEGHVLYRRLLKAMPRIVRGEGCWLYDDAGKRYLDASGGALVSNLGHGNAEIAQAIGAQAARLAYVSGVAFTHDAVEELATELSALTAEGLDKSLFCCNGGDAVEAALKLARQFWAESGRPEKRKIVSFSPSYHGNTLLALSASGRPAYRKWFEDWTIPVCTLPAPYAYRCACRGEDDGCSVCSGTAFEDLLVREGPESVAAFIAEPIGGVSTGAAVPRADYWKTIRAICDRHEILFIADEILVGAGRTGTWSALEPYAAVPDFQVFGKGIAGGYAPLSAVVTSRRIIDVLAEGSGAPAHNQTFSQHPVSCAAGLAAIRQMKSMALVERSAQMGEILHRHLGVLLEHPNVGDIRGRGLLAGIEFVEDRASRKSFDPSVRFAENFTRCAQDAGLVVWPNAGYTEREDGDLVLIAPPFIIDEGEIAELVERFQRALDATVVATRV
jgi:adenosylmethionine-8-amino-7-oxononanoate aminotransferase